MTTTDDLTKRIARILNDEGWTFEGVHEPGEYDECEDCRRVVDPIAARIAEEVAAHDARVRRDAWDACYHQMVTAPGRGVIVTKKSNPYAPERRETP